MRPVFSVAFYLYGRFVKRQRARVVVQNQAGEILLVRNWARPNRWSLPGGGVKKREASIDAVKRELFEETGLNAPKNDFKLLTTIAAPRYNSPIYSLRVHQQSLPVKRHNTHEITHIGWFDINDLPPLTFTARAAVQLIA